MCSWYIVLMRLHYRRISQNSSRSRNSPAGSDETSHGNLGGISGCDLWPEFHRTGRLAVLGCFRERDVAIVSQIVIIVPNPCRLMAKTKRHPSVPTIARMYVVNVSSGIAQDLLYPKQYHFGHNSPFIYPGSGRRRNTYHKCHRPKGYYSHSRPYVLQQRQTHMGRRRSWISTWEMDVSFARQCHKLTWCRDIFAYDELLCWPSFMHVSVLSTALSSGSDWYSESTSGFQFARAEISECCSVVCLFPI